MDFYKHIASHLFGCPPDEVTPEQRKTAKNQCDMYFYMPERLIPDWFKVEYQEWKSTQWRSIRD